MPSSTESFIQNLPKAELHVHLEGCITPDLALTLAKRNSLPPPPHLTSLSKTDSYDFHDLSSFLQIYYSNLSVLITAADFHDLALTYLTKASSQNIVHAELFFDPQAHTSRGIPFPTLIRGYLSGLATARAQTGISASLIMCFLRDQPASYAMATLMEALPYKDSIIGIGLDSDERSNPPSKFTAVYARAKQEGFMLTAHCDIDQPNTLTHISEALHELGCSRIDHGTNIVASEEMTEYVVKNGIGLTCCPISNSIVTPDFKGKEILDLLRRGARVTINSDDPAYFRGYVCENLQLMANKTHVTRRELVQFERNAFEISWISSWQRAKFLEKLEEFEKAWCEEDAFS